MNSLNINLEGHLAVEKADAEPPDLLQHANRAPFFVEIRLWLNPDQKELWEAYAAWSVTLMRDHGGEYLGRPQIEPQKGGPDSISVFAFPCKAAYQAYRSDIVTLALDSTRRQCVDASEYNFPQKLGELAQISCTAQ